MIPAGIGTTAIQDPVGTVQLAPLDVELRPALNATGNRYNGTVDGTTGQFVIRNVLPGLYNLATFISNMDAATTVDVRNRDVENASLSLSPGFPIADSSDDGRCRTRNSASRRVDHADRQQSSNSGHIAQSARRSRSGSFSIPNVGTDDTRVYVLPMLSTPVMAALNIPDQLQGVYVKSAKLGGVDVSEYGIPFRRRAGQGSGDRPCEKCRIACRASRRRTQTARVPAFS